MTKKTLKPRKLKGSKHRQMMTEASFQTRSGLTLAQAVQLGMQHLSRGDLRKARNVYSEILRKLPNQPMALHHLGVVEFQAGNFEKAVAHLRKAVEGDPSAPDAFNNLGLACHNAGYSDEALNAFETAIGQKPDYAAAYYNASLVHEQMADYGAALEKLGRAVEIAPDYAEAHYRRGLMYEYLDDSHSASDAYYKAVTHKPDLLAQKPGMITWFEKVNQIERAEKILEVVKGQNIFTQLWQEFLTAQILYRKEKPKDAGALLEKWSETAERSTDKLFQQTFFHLKARVHDACGEPRLAFDAFERSNRATASTEDAARYDGERYRRAISGEFNAVRDLVADQAAFAQGQNEPAPVFLVGFPRSGTTLLDTVLRSHPEIDVIEEKHTVNAARWQLTKTWESKAASRSSLTQENVAMARRAYWEEAAKYVDPNKDKIIIDKLPLRSAEVGLIKLLFPSAKFVLAIRHPYDSVLSCFMQNFALNNAMIQFLDLQKSAEFYDFIMSTWMDYQSIMAVDYHTTKYEDMVEDFEGTVRAILGFLQVEWHENVRDYAETARKRGRINTPSYSQVVQPLYKRAAGRWVKYREHLEPIFPILRPWAEKFGYPTDLDLDGMA